MESNYNVLIVDDDKDILKVIRLFLEKAGMNVYEAYDGEMALIMIKNYDIHLMIADIMMPRMTGYQLIQHVRESSSIPIMVISAKNQLEERILGLDLGADDYITKPFEPLEVVARVHARLRRFNEEESKVPNHILSYMDMKLDSERCILIASGQTIDLTKTELALMEAFMKRPGKVFTKEELYECAWGSEFYAVEDNTIRVTISRLRDKIGEKRIKTIRGLGYRME